ncbi:MAG: phosphatidate cytidylyltransferase [Segetibacter sp.]|nr:phosphatidate cytidylyltransferase [Segetibacter sp.]
MAFNLHTFKTRTLTAMVFVAIMLAGLLWNHWSFLLLFTVIHFGCWLEYQKLIGLIDKDYKEITAFHKYSTMLTGFALMLWMLHDVYRFGDLKLASIGWWILLICAVVLPIVEVLFSNQLSLRSIGLSFLGLLYISLSWALMMEIRGFWISDTGSGSFSDSGRLLPIILIASIWINDTMAYLVGSFIGKTPLSKISPKKTWEGTIGGAILCVVAVTLGSYYWLKIEDVGLLIGISLIAAVVGTVGDLLESKIKRLAGVKDSGQIMPGHGGFLDRFDSLLLATPVVWLFLTLWI